MSGGIETEADRQRQRDRDLQALRELAKARAAAGEVERPPLRGFTERDEPIWERISCS